MTIDEAVKRVSGAIAKRLANGGRTASVVVDHDLIRVGYEVRHSPTRIAIEDEYPADEFCRLVDEAVEYAGRFDEPDFDEALHFVGMFF
jgi:hypothetical protein